MFNVEIEDPRWVDSQTPRQKIGDGHPDLQLFHQDRIKNGFGCILFPANFGPSINFFRGLKESPCWLSPTERPVLDSIESRKEHVQAYTSSSNLTQRLFKMTSLPEVLAHCQNQREHYLGQSKFSTWQRSSDNASQLTSCWLDLDFYKSSVRLDIKNTLAVDHSAVELILDKCMTAGRNGRWFIPNQIIRSGRGLYVKWIFNHYLPGVAGPRWKHCQDQLVKLFADFGADAQAKDAARVLRVVGSVNSKNGAVVKVIHRAHQSYTISFDDLAGAVLERKRANETDRRATKLLMQKYEKDQEDRVANGEQPYRRKEKKEWNGTGEKWATIVARELTNLAQFRGKESVRGHIELFTFVIMNYKLLGGQVVSETDFHLQVHELGLMMGADLVQLSGQVKNLYLRFQAGDHLYHYRKSNLVALFRIADAELSITPVLARKAGSGVSAANTPRAARPDLHQRARLLERAGLTLVDIADQLGVSTKTVKRYLFLNVQAVVLSR